MKLEYISTEAADLPHSAEGWVARLASPEAGPADQAAFEAWCEASPDNRAGYVRAEHLHARVRELAQDALIGAAARAALRDAAAQRSRRSWRWAALAASVALAALVSGVYWRGAGEQRYDTRLGERREVRLDDGTRALLDTDSAISVRYSAQRRALTVERGRVEIDVAAEPGRPFVTYAANGTIHDIGTRFQVSRQPDQVLVTLLEGEVAIETPQSAGAPTVLKPGAQAQIDAAGGIAAGKADIDAARGWPRGELVFKDRALADLVGEMNRYSAVQVRLGEPALGRIAVSGVFHAGDQEALIKALQSGWSLRAEREAEGEIVLRAPMTR
ncbi:FecR family protein [Tahibacter harae]|uniref:FecR domain-containing protein n=1 Tax=Tahibacter harae TaxID=2963937 RepID=A0ABT1QTA8_9GAMM|nr:FecR domain-containing protein [Tahibacter harae]MCQ4165535.1 FecR domain-containing protein [Tahibacter harae]